MHFALFSLEYNAFVFVFYILRMWLRDYYLFRDSEAKLRNCYSITDNWQFITVKYTIFKVCFGFATIGLN